MIHIFLRFYFDESIIMFYTKIGKSINFMVFSVVTSNIFR